jgi:hypothetical protein
LGVVGDGGDCDSSLLSPSTRITITVTATTTATRQGWFRTFCFCSSGPKKGHCHYGDRASTAPNDSSRDAPVFAFWFDCRSVMDVSVFFLPNGVPCEPFPSSFSSTEASVIPSSPSEEPSAAIDGSKTLGFAKPAGHVARGKWQVECQAANLPWPGIPSRHLVALRRSAFVRLPPARGCAGRRGTVAGRGSSACRLGAVGRRTAAAVAVTASGGFSQWRGMYGPKQQ